MVDTRRRQAARRRRDRTRVGGVAFVACGILSVASCLKPIAKDLTRRTELALTEAGFTDLSVAFKGREGVITGLVDHHAALYRVEETAEAVRGVRWVDVSGIQVGIGARVKPAAPAPVKPVAQAPIKAATPPPTPKAAPPPAQFSMSVAGKQVTLRGVVPTQRDKDAAGTAAAELYGPKSVDNRLQVKANTTRPGWLRQLWGAVAALKPVREPGLSTADGALTVRGRVDDEATKRSVGRAVVNACPDLRVENRLKVIEAVAEAKDTFARLMEEVQGKGIYFESASAEIKPAGARHLDKVVQLLQAIDTVKVSIVGHTDSVGGAASNKTLSRRRANAVTRYLVSKGIARKRLRAWGWGERRPIASNKTEEGRALNRRIEFVVKGR